jgi:tetratricopeptide (TPR) repeat protein
LSIVLNFRSKSRCHQLYKKYIDKNPYSEIAWHQLGRLHYSVKEYENAIRAFEYATLIDDEFMGAFMEKAKAYERLKKYDKAIEITTVQSN